MDNPDGSWRATAQQFVTAEFQVPPPTTARLVVTPLVVGDIWLDFPTCARNAAHIRATVGGDWPADDLSWEDDLIDLAFHQREHELGRSFAYKIVTPDELDMIGCLYIYPPGHPFNSSPPADLSPDCDAVVNYWVTAPAFAAGVHLEVHEMTEQWIRMWPFEHPRIRTLKPPTS